MALKLRNQWLSLSGVVALKFRTSGSERAGIIRDVETFAAAVLLADNIDMVAKTKGTVELCFTFHGLAKKIGRVDV